MTTIEAPVIGGTRRPVDGQASGSFVDLLLKMQDMLNQHPMGSNIRLVFMPEDSPTLSPDTILTEIVDAQTGVITLTPRKLQELSSEDMLHDASKINVYDQEFFAYATRPQAKYCYTDRAGTHHEI